MKKTTPKWPARRKLPCIIHLHHTTDVWIISILGTLSMGVSINGGTSKWMVYNIEHAIKTDDDWESLHFRKHPYLHGSSAIWAPKSVQSPWRNCPDQVSIVVLQLNRNLGTFSVAVACDPVAARHRCPSAGRCKVPRSPEGPLDIAGFYIYMCIYIYTHAVLEYIYIYKQLSTYIHVCICVYINIYIYVYYMLCRKCLPAHGPHR